MSIQTEIDRIISAVHAAHKAVIAKGGTTSEPYLVANLKSAIETIKSADEVSLEEFLLPVIIDRDTMTYSPSYDEIGACVQAVLMGAPTKYPILLDLTGSLVGAFAGVGKDDAWVFGMASAITDGADYYHYSQLEGYWLHIDGSAEPFGYFEMSTLDNPATSSDIVKGKSAYVLDGDNFRELLHGTYEPPEPTLQSKTVSPSTSSQTVKPDTGYDGLSQVTVNAMPTATQATPSISVSSAGLITASATQTAGYVSAGTKSATKQLTTQAAKTVTPGTSNQTAVASGRYTTGAITVKGDANLKAENIKSGVSIFGVAGSHSGAEDLSAELTEYSALNTELESVIDSLPSAGGGSGMETCEVTIVQRWGMNDDPDFLHLYVPYYKVLADGSIEEDFVYVTSTNDFEEKHSVTFTALKNVPINVVAFSGLANAIKYTTSATGGEIVARQSPSVISVRGGLYTLTPTADTATFTFASA